MIRRSVEPEIKRNARDDGNGDSWYGCDQRKQADDAHMQARSSLSRLACQIDPAKLHSDQPEHREDEETVDDDRGKGDASIGLYRRQSDQDRKGYTGRHERPNDHGYAADLHPSGPRMVVHAEIEGALSALYQ